ncbi:hypothetical protein J5N97_017317 [Dioscorea zingiberensis]|uniref:Uncharacterized protein n=1 Tax=Dioscorea zingiberensis TaxID=325984 RepID=A0A9D5CLR5_9LILI|nr:hypothetical protein J5N97_017317 [Dioscorea zingiberensis]
MALWLLSTLGPFISPPGRRVLINNLPNVNKSGNLHHPLPTKLKVFFSKRDGSDNSGGQDPARNPVAGLFLVSITPLAAIAPFSHRHLAFDSLPEDIQLLRCKDMAAHTPACDFGVYGWRSKNIKFRQKAFPIDGRCMHSDIFISASPGNMHNAMVGHRTFENLRTIRPNMALLGQLFLNKSMDWSEFQQAVQVGHKNRQGQIRLRKAKQSIYTYPAPDCMCHG